MKTRVSRESIRTLLRRVKPFLAIVLLQFGFAGMDILSKAALNNGMNNYVFVVYRQATATLIMAPLALIFDKQVRPRMTLSIFGKIMLLSILEPVLAQNLYILGMKDTTATFAVSVLNIIPAMTFFLAWICRLENVQLTSIHSQARIAGTIAVVAGAMITTLVTGPHIGLPWTRGRKSHEHQQNRITLKHFVTGSVMITLASFVWSCFVILQTVMVETYPAVLSLTAWICLLGTVEGAIVALAMEKGKTGHWSIKWDTKLLAIAYSGIFGSGIAFYVQGIVLKERGPVFVSAFNPLSLIIVAVLSSFILSEQLYLGRAVGAIVIVIGLYLVVWGQRNEQKSTAMKEKEVPVTTLVDKTELVDIEQMSK